MATYPMAYHREGRWQLGIRPMHRWSCRAASVEHIFWSRQQHQHDRCQENRIRQMINSFFQRLVGELCLFSYELVRFTKRFFFASPFFQIKRWIHDAFDSFLSCYGKSKSTDKKIISDQFMQRQRINEIVLRQIKKFDLFFFLLVSLFFASFFLYYYTFISLY